MIDAIKSRGPFTEALTSLAVGSDQLFAKACLGAGIPVTAIIPLPDYDRFFTGDGLKAYRRLLDHSQPIQLAGAVDPETAFLEAGLHVANRSDLLILVWDGEPAAGRGGVGDIADHARNHGIPFLHLNPITRTTRASP
ncbi:hypothetical protein ACIQC9_07075 [Brevundimonas sp. NPDC092305]|uniref:hypothetical protein n=1 Tax=Brevundimonas sp. NPDC092305 TaxID=3363957 RepID=UPI003801C2E9